MNLDFDTVDFVNLVHRLGAAGWFNGSNIVQKGDSLIHFSLKGNQKMFDFIHLLKPYMPDVFGAPARLNAPDQDGSNIVNFLLAEFEPSAFTTGEFSALIKLAAEFWKKYGSDQSIL